MDINGIMKNKITKKSTIRDIMQILGTDLLRQGFNNNIHVAATLGSIKENEKVIITDTRFPNELKAVKEKGGISIRVEREPKLCGTCGRTRREQRLGCHDIICPKGQPKHISETALTEAEFDFTIINDGSIEELITKVKNILIEIKVINK